MRQIVRKSQLRHGMKVKCVIGGTVINDAKISINDNGKIYICQNLAAGDHANDKMGYQYSWTIMRADEPGWEGVTNLYAEDLPIEEGVMANDIIIKGDTKRMILATLDKIIFVSNDDDFLTPFPTPFTLEQIIKDGWKLENNEKDTVVSFTYEELKEKLGYDFKIAEK